MSEKRPEENMTDSQKQAFRDVANKMKDPPAPTPPRVISRPSVRSLLPLVGLTKLHH